MAIIITPIGPLGGELLQQHPERDYPMPEVHAPRGSRSLREGAPVPMPIALRNPLSPSPTPSPIPIHISNP